MEGKLWGKRLRKLDVLQEAVDFISQYSTLETHANLSSSDGICGPRHQKICFKVETSTYQFRNKPHGIEWQPPPQYWFLNPLFLLPGIYNLKLFKTHVHK